MQLTRFIYFISAILDFSFGIALILFFKSISKLFDSQQLFLESYMQVLGVNAVTFALMMLFIAVRPVQNADLIKCVVLNKLLLFGLCLYYSFNNGLNVFLITAAFAYFGLTSLYFYTYLVIAEADIEYEPI